MRRFLAIVVALLTGVTVTTSASAATFAYDVPAFARVDAHAFGVAHAGPTRPSDARKGPASLRVEGPGASTTPSRSLVATKAASLADEGFIDPSSIRFSQSSVSPNLSAGGSIDDMAAGLRSGSVAPGDVPPIRIFENNGQWTTLDNRRLVAFQQAGVEMPYRLATAEEIAAEAWKLTTTNGGTSITIRQGGGTWP